MKKRLLSILLAIVMVVGLLPMVAFAADFADTTDHWAKDHIDRWSNYEVVKGKDDGVFDPDAPMTRAEAAKVFAELLGLNKIGNIEGFKDVDRNAWYYEALAKCYAAGIMNGRGNGIIDPQGNISREEFFAMFGRALQLRDAYEAPEAKSVLADAGFRDTAKVSDWAAGQIEILVSRNFVGGVTETELAPQDDINRASVMALLDKSISTYVGKTATAEEAKTVEAKGEGITLIANTNTTLVTGNADIVIVAAGAEIYKEETQTFEHNDVRVESSSMPVARVAGENITVTVAVNSTTDDAAVTWTGVDSEIIFEGGTSAKYVNAEAEGSRIIIKQGAKAETVTVAETAKNAKVEIAQGATATNVAVAAESANVTVAGTVTKVEVEETAKNTTVATESTAKVETVENKAENTAVTGTGKVETVKTSEDVKIETNTTVENTNTEKEIKVETKSGDEIQVEKKDETKPAEDSKTDVNTDVKPGTTGGDIPAHVHFYDPPTDYDMACNTCHEISAAKRYSVATQIMTIVNTYAGSMVNLAYDDNTKTVTVTIQDKNKTIHDVWDAIGNNLNNLALDIVAANNAGFVECGGARLNASAVTRMDSTATKNFVNSIRWFDREENEVKGTTPLSKVIECNDLTATVHYDADTWNDFTIEFVEAN